LSQQRWVAERSLTWLLDCRRLGASMNNAPTCSNGIGGVIIDTEPFDRLVKSLSTVGTRRRLLRLVAPFPWLEHCSPGLRRSCRASATARTYVAMEADWPVTVEVGVVILNTLLDLLLEELPLLIKTRASSPPSVRPA
jgi:hypothetical protein